MNDEEEILRALRAEARESTPEDESRRLRRPWWAFLLILLAPMLISLLALSVDSGNYGQAGMLAFLFGCPVAGIIAGCLFAKGLRQHSDGRRVVAAFIMSIVFTVAAAGLSMGGCLLVIAH